MPMAISSSTSVMPATRVLLRGRDVIFVQSIFRNQCGRLALVCNVPRGPAQGERYLAGVRRISFGQVRGIDGQSAGVEDALISGRAERVKSPGLGVGMRQC